jgi:prephenate dehydrogenase
VGLLGGSIGQALIRRRLAGQVVGVGRRAAALRAARRLGAISAGTTDLARGVRRADLVVLCVPVDQIAPLACAAAHHGPPQMVITDVGSTKAAVCAAIESAGSVPRFVGSHPLAGSEKTGVEHARSTLLKGRLVVVTPTPATDAAACREVELFWTRLGARVHRLSPAEHDQALAVTSHLPHLAAAAIAAATPEEYLTLTASGWRDTTRVAAGDPTLWRQIVLSNRAHALAALALLDERLAELRAALVRGDAARLEELLNLAKCKRDAVGS